MESIPAAIRDANPLELTLGNRSDHGDGAADRGDGALAVAQGHTRVERAKSKMVVYLLWTLFQGRADGVQLFTQYVTQLVNANIIPKEDALDAHLCLSGNFGAFAADLFEAVPSASDWAATPAVPRGVSTAVGLPTSPTKMLQQLRSSLASSSVPTRYEEMFEECEELGRGGFGSITRAQHRADLKFYAVKKIRCRLPKQQLDERGGLNAYLHSRILREAQVICQMDHPHIVRYYNTWVEVKWAIAPRRRGSHSQRRRQGPLGSPPRGSDASVEADWARRTAAVATPEGDIEISVDEADINSVDTARSSSSSSSGGGSRPPAADGTRLPNSINSFSDLSSSLSSGPGLISVSSSSKDRGTPSPRGDRADLGRARSPVTPVPESEINSQGNSTQGDSIGSPDEHLPTTLRLAVHEDSSESSSSSAATSIDSDYSAVSVSTGVAPGSSGIGAVPARDIGTDIIVRQNPFEHLLLAQHVSASSSSSTSAGECKNDLEDVGASQSGVAHLYNHARQVSEGVLARPLASRSELATIIAGGLEGNVVIYIQMELCHAHSLADRLRVGPAGGYGPYNDLEKAGTLEMLLQLVSAVKYLHRQGVVHRDIKPANIMFALDAHGGAANESGAGCVKLGDFGLAVYGVDDEVHGSEAESEVDEEQGRTGEDEEVEEKRAKAGQEPSLSAGSETGKAGLSASTGGTSKVDASTSGDASDGRIEDLDEISSSGSSRSTWSRGSSTSGSFVGGLSSTDNHAGARGVGTALYAAPEQLSWKGTDASQKQGAGPAHAAADVYSLGVTICEVVGGFYTASERMLALRALTGRDVAACSGGGATAVGRLPEGFAPALPALGTLVLEMVQHDPEQRPTIDEVASRLASMQADLAAKRKVREENSAKEVAAAKAARSVRVGELLSSPGTERPVGSSLLHDTLDQSAEHTIASQRQIIETLRAQLRAAGMVPAA